MIKSYPFQTALELACAAYRANSGYISERSIFEHHKPPGTYTNKELMLVAMGAIDTKKYEDQAHKPVLLCTNLEDQEFASSITKFYKRLLFDAIQGEDQFRMDLFAVMSKDEVLLNKLGFVACLPTSYIRDRYEHSIQKVDKEHLSTIGSELYDLDCEILKSSRSKNYNAFNIDAIINNKLVSWMGKTGVKLGPAVLISGKVKDHSYHWQHNTIPVTRLNYVKVFQ